MWPDPTIHKKPRYPGGTPFNKASIIFAAVCGSLIYGGIHLITYTPGYQRFLEKQAIIDDQREEKNNIKQMMMDPLIQNAVARKLQEHNPKIPDM